LGKLLNNSLIIPSQLIISAQINRLLKCQNQVLAQLSLVNSLFSRFYLVLEILSIRLLQSLEFKLQFSDLALFLG